MKCDCEDWKNSEPQIRGFTVLAFSHGMKYTGEEFQYCPWCGVILKTNDEVDEKAEGWRESERA